MNGEEETSALEEFVKELARVAATDGDVHAYIADTAVRKPANITAVLDGDGGGVIWARDQGDPDGQAQLQNAALL